MTLREIYLTLPQRRFAGLLLAGAVAVPLSACGAANDAQSQAAVAAAAPTAPTPSPPTQSGTLPQGSEPVDLDPADFTTDIDNPYWPMSPGSRWVYAETDSAGTKEDIVIEVLQETKRIANGVVARVVRDTVTEDGVPVEITDDWFAQDKAGNIWYLGEYVTNYEDGKVVDHAGSFEAGVDGAQAGIALPANPTPGMSYRQEYYKGEAEDRGAIVTVGEEQVEVPFGYFTKDILMTRDLVPTEPKVQELKFYALGIGPLLSMHTDGAFGRSVLVSYTPGGQGAAPADLGK
ncbi:hypothetical protein [Sporichthya sp.]|uniref:hypothetical protein n=1 Tax=Sporichthya sp. TaxID=65475 RepID=UPI0017D89E78|nr:hypothetical protein [Sporichthya sp.]MBA3742367.1 hypothetical protein [Sporichthya sp.]